MNTKGFTLIELLVVISIIGLLSVIAMTSMSGARAKAKRVSFQNTVSSIQRMYTVCCDVDNSTLYSSSSGSQPSAGSPICRNKADYSAMSDLGIYPDAKSVGTITVMGDCSSDGFNVTINPGTDTMGGWASAVCNRDECQFS